MPPLGLIAIDATTLLRWAKLAPVGIIRLERMIVADFLTQFDARVMFVKFTDGAYRRLEPAERRTVDDLCCGATAANHVESQPVPHGGGRSSAAKHGARMLARRALLRSPEPLRPLLFQSITANAALVLATARLVRDSRGGIEGRIARIGARGQHRENDLQGVHDLIILGLGWEYLDYEYLYNLKLQAGIRIHMPAFDLIPIVDPQLNPGQSSLVHRHYTEMAHICHQIICISHATEQAVRALYQYEQLPQPTLDVVQLPSFLSAADAPAQRSPLVPTVPFVLYVSTIEIRKNHILLLKLWLELIRAGHTMPRLVFVGRRGWLVDDVYHYAESNAELRPFVSILHDVPDADLASLYQHCLFTVFPSRTEGWGLPITESLSMGKVCVHSTDPAQVEASQGLMPALHPDDFMAWRHELLRLIDDEPYRVSMEANIAGTYVSKSPDAYCREFRLAVVGHST